MVNRRTIQSFVNQLAALFRPERVILFGSYAYGKPTGDSDVDLLVIMPHSDHPATKAAEIRNRVRAGFPVDMVVRSPAEVRRRLAQGDFFIREVIERGTALYECDHKGMAAKSRS